MEKQETIKLSPCGCGGKATILKAKKEGVAAVICESCLISTEMMEEASAIEVWNRAMGHDERKENDG